MKTPIALIFLVAGIVMIVCGINATQSVASDFSRFFTGAATDKSIWLLLGGIVAAILGLFGLMRGGKSS